MTDYNLLKAFLCLLCLRGYDYTFPRSPTPYGVYSVLVYNSKTGQFRCAEAVPASYGKYYLWLERGFNSVFTHVRWVDERSENTSTELVILHRPMKGEKIE